MSEKFREIVKRYKPRHASLKTTKRNEAIEAQVLARPVIYIPRLPRSRSELFAYFHEVAHVALRHLHADDHKESPAYVPQWRQEFEAETWAIAAMRAERIPVPASTMKRAREYVRECIEKAADGKHPCDDPEVLKFAYGRRWRAYA